MARIAAEPFDRKVISFYRYVRITDPVALRHELFAEWRALGALGRIYVSQEGINAQMSVPEPRFEMFKELLYNRVAFKNVPFKVGVEQANDAFWKLTIKVKHQIVADGLAPDEYDVTNVGTHLSAREFNKKIDEGVTVVDMRRTMKELLGALRGRLYQMPIPFVRNCR